MVEKDAYNSPKHSPKRITAFDRKLAAHIRQLRLYKDISQDAISKKLGISSTQYQKYEQARTRLTIQRFMEIAAVLEVQPAVLLQEELDLLGIKNDLNHLVQLIMLYSRKIDNHLGIKPTLTDLDVPIF